MNEGTHRATPDCPSCAALTVALREAEQQRDEWQRKHSEMTRAAEGHFRGQLDAIRKLDASEQAREAAVQGERCDKCGRYVPRQSIAIELQDGAPIDDPAGFMWCHGCHCQRAMDAFQARAEAAEVKLAEAERTLAEQAETQLAEVVRRGKECAAAARRPGGA